jgi:hypothetical protein
MSLADRADVARRKDAEGGQPTWPLKVIVERMGPPISSVRYAPDVVAQRLEILPITLRQNALFWLKPVHAPSLQIGLARTAQPGSAVIDAMGWYPLTPRVVHSTSWRFESGQVVLTYIAVVQPPGKLPPGSLDEVAIERTDLARGTSLAPPKAIGVTAVLEHALRHLSWLIRDDAAIAEALPDYAEILASYQPEPFRALG